MMDRELTALLERLSLVKYMEVMEENEMDMEVLPLCTEEDFKEIGIPKGPRIKLLRALQQPAGTSAMGLTPSTPVKTAGVPALQPTTPENPTQEKIMQRLLEQARVKDEKIRQLESAALHGLDREAASSPTPPITPPQRPSQSSAGGTSQEDFEDQKSDHSSLASGRYSPGSQQASQEGLADVWAAPSAWTGADFEAEPAEAALQRTMDSASSASTPLVQGLQGEVVWSGGDEADSGPFGVIAVSASSQTRGPADRYFMYKSDVDASGLSASQVKEAQKLTFDVYKRNPLEQQKTSPEAVLMYVRNQRDAWIEWLRREGLSDVGNDPRRHETATMEAFRREHFAKALAAGDKAATEACLVAVNLRLPSAQVQPPRKDAWTAKGNSAATSAFTQVAQLDSPWAAAAASSPAKPSSPVGGDDAGSPSAPSSIWGDRSSFGVALWNSGDAGTVDPVADRQPQPQGAALSEAAAIASTPAQAAASVGAGSWAAKAMKQPSVGAWGKSAPSPASATQAVPDLAEPQSFPGLGHASQPNSMAGSHRGGAPSMAEVAAAPPPQSAEPPSLMDVATTKKQDKKALKKLRKQQQQAAREAEAEASRLALAAMDSDKLQADVALASLGASTVPVDSESRGGSEPKMSRRARERQEEAEKEKRRQEKEEEQLLKQRIRMAKSKGQSWSKDVLENQRHRSGASRRRMDATGN